MEVRSISRSGQAKRESFGCNYNSPFIPSSSATTPIDVFTFHSVTLKSAMAFLGRSQRNLELVFHSQLSVEAYCIPTTYDIASHLQHHFKLHRYIHE